MKKIMLRVGAIIGIIALIVFIAIVASPTIAKTLPYNIIGATCFFVFMLGGVPCITLIFDPDATVPSKKRNEKNDQK